MPPASPLSNPQTLTPNPYNRRAMVTLSYERGDPNEPKGHAFLYFGAAGERDVVATYIVVPPINIDVVKYVPPLLASTIGGAGPGMEAPFLPIPPLPEATELTQLLGLAELRDDDILAGGPRVGDDPSALLGRVVEIGAAYAEAYHQSIAQAPQPGPEPEPELQQGESPQVRALLYTTLTESERMEGLARELGSLRYGLEGGDRELVEASLAEMRAIAASLPAKYRAHQLLDVATRTDPSSLRLAQLYLERGYKLCAEDYGAIPAIEEEIASLGGSSSA